MLAQKFGLKSHINLDTAAMTKQEEPVTRAPEPRESPDQDVLLELEVWRRKLQRLLQRSDIMELRWRLDTGTCAPPLKELLPHIEKRSLPAEKPPLPAKKLSPLFKELLMPAKKSSFPVNDSTQQPLASYIATSQMPGKDLNANTSSSPPPGSRKSRTGLELKTHEVDRIASLGDEQKVTKREEWTKAGLGRDEPPQGKLAEDADPVR